MKEKDLTGLDAVTLEELHRMVSYQRETYWKHRILWHNNGELNSKDPEEFYYSV